MAQQAYDALSEKRRLESTGFAAKQAEAIVETMSRTMTANQQLSRRLDGLTDSVAEVKSDLAGVKSELTEVKIDLASVKRGVGEMATRKDLEAAVAIVRADMYRALWVQGLSLGTLILGLAVVVATAAVF